jgi:pimeloyl-ACP methyl ester carboxylesterase
MTAANPNAADMLVTIAAEDVFDAESDLPGVVAPTLVIGGDRDQFYSRELFELTAAGVQHGRAFVWPGRAHMRTVASKSSAYLALGFLLG